MNLFKFGWLLTNQDKRREKNKREDIIKFDSKKRSEKV